MQASPKKKTETRERNDLLMKTVAVIMAGGRGERFWPYSRQERPKQFISLTEDGRTLIRCTVDRIKPLVQPEDIYIVTGGQFIGTVHEQLPEIPLRNILCEPQGRNTAPCIGFAAEVIKKRYEDAVMLVLPSDHLLRDELIYVDHLRRCADTAARSGCLMTLGITPTYPETGYGYIQYGEQYTEHGAAGIYNVKRFVEKPNLKTATEYLAHGNYLWNSGMFVFAASSILAHFERLLPEHYAELCRIGEAVDTPRFDVVLAESFERMKPVSIDYGIMEKSDDILTMPGSFGWDDVGNWNAIARIRVPDDNGNVSSGDVLCEDTENCILMAGKKPMITLGLSNIVAVDCDDVIFLCDRGSTQDIKKVIETMKKSCYKSIL